MIVTSIAFASGALYTYAAFRWFKGKGWRVNNLGECRGTDPRPMQRANAKAATGSVKSAPTGNPASPINLHAVPVPDFAASEKERRMTLGPETSEAQEGKAEMRGPHLVHTPAAACNSLSAGAGDSPSSMANGFCEPDARHQTTPAAPLTGRNARWLSGWHSTMQ